MQKIHKSSASRHARNHVHAQSVLEYMLTYSWAKGKTTPNATKNGYALKKGPPEINEYAILI